MESIQLVLIGNTYIDSVAILASAKKSQLEDIANKIRSIDLYQTTGIHK